MRSLLKFTFLFLIFFGCLDFASAQELNHVLGDILVKIDKKERIDNLVEKFQHFQGKPTRLRVVNQPSRPMNIWLLHFDHNTIHEYHFLEFLRRQSGIEVAQFNHLVTMRQTTPNDNLFGNQWQYVNDGSNGGVVDADIDADLAWDITTGGLTADGDTIVVAVLDGGINLSHQDFEDNLWVNHGEIPGDNIDNDNNGYTDDYLGWNPNSNTDNISGGSHGTAVAGIIGAKGNNTIGVTGVNWNVKIMVIKNDFNTNEAAVLAAYTYPLVMRQKYNETNGAEGAFVVATNASWGVDFGQPEDAPLWCDFYDTLGVAGILSCGATINSNQNVDEVGDLPTACPSDYLISVTNTNRSDNKVNQAGYGATTIDLGAPGAEAYTTSNNNSYAPFGGTSGATPHVTGAIALLYSAPCSNLIALAKANPAAAALQVKDYILNGVDPNASLNGITVTGGRLNLFNSLSLLLDDCGPCPQAVSLNAYDITGTQALLDWTPGINSIGSIIRWRKMSSPIWITVNDAEPPYLFEGTDACTEYEFQIDAVCENENSGFTESYFFITDGCCDPPHTIIADVTSNTSATITWNSVLAADTYTVFLNGPGGIVEYPNITETSFDINTLFICSSYSVGVYSICGGEISAPPEFVFFSTQGCGPCTDLDYCASEGESTQYEWINSVRIDFFTNISGDDGGYGDYTGTAIDLMTFNSYEITLTPGFSEMAYGEYFKVWIDFNQDGNFEEPDELVFDPGMSSDQPTIGNILIPGNTPPGITRMRVGMRWGGQNGTLTPPPCGDFPSGEVEDYCVNIIPGEPSGCDLPTALDTLDLTTNETFIIWEDDSDDHIDHNLRYKKTSESTWTIVENVSAPLALFGLEECVEYEVQVEANCADGTTTSGYTESFNFFTKCGSNVNELPDSRQFSVYPVPFTDYLAVEFYLQKTTDIRFDLFSTNGQKISTSFFETLGQGSHKVFIKNLESVPAGVYFLKMLTSDDSVKIKKVIKY